MKKIIINCDDLGISKETNETIFEILKYRKASSASIIVNSKHFNHASKIISKYFKKYHFGIHFNLTEGKAISKISKVYYNVIMLAISLIHIKFKINNLQAVKN